MAAKIKDDEIDAINLESWRLVINCSEPVRQESHQEFLTRFQRYGLMPAALASCYAMAEATFAATQTPPGTEPTSLALDRNDLARGIARGVWNGDPARICVSPRAEQLRDAS